MEVYKNYIYYFISYSIKKFCEIIAKKLNKNVKIISNNKKTKNYVSKNNILIKKFKFLKFENFIRRYL